MSGNILQFAVLLLAIISSLTIGCKDRTDGIVVQPDGQIMVFGTIESIDDAVPVDGGVTVQLRISAETSIDLYLESFFTATPPPPGRWEVYESIQKLVPGDRVQMIVEKKDDRLWMRWVTKL